MTEWPQYQSNKIVRAAKIVLIEDHPDGTRTLMVRPENSFQPEPFTPTEPAEAKQATLGGWAVLYKDGFKSVLPEQAFEDLYDRIAR